MVPGRQCKARLSGSEGIWQGRSSRDRAFPERVLFTIHYLATPFQMALKPLMDNELYGLRSHDSAGAALLGRDTGVND